MKNLKKLIIISSFFFITYSPSYSEVPYFVDFKYILNQSNAGKDAQNFLKKKLDNGIKNIQKKEKTIQEEERKLIQKKKVISAEEYKSQVKELRKKVNSLQKERNNLLESVAKQRSTARNELLKNLNPIISDYMKEKKIRMVVDKKSILLADENLDLTKEITDLLNKKLKKIKLN